MSNVQYVSTREQLKLAISQRPDMIVITDEALATKVKIVSKASKPALIAALAAAGVSAGMAWNPIGWTVGIVSTTVAAPLIAAVAFLIVALGVGTLMAIQKDWKVSASGEVAAPGFEAKGSVTLTPKK